MAKQSDRGNSIGDAQALGQAILRQAQPLYRFEALRERQEEVDVFLTGIRIRLPGEYGSEYLVVFSGLVGGQYVVAFHAGSTLIETLSSGLRRLENGVLQWKVDEFKKE